MYTFFIAPFIFLSMHFGCFELYKVIPETRRMGLKLNSIFSIRFTILRQPYFNLSEYTINLIILLYFSKVLSNNVDKKLKFSKKCKLKTWKFKHCFKKKICVNMINTVIIFVQGGIGYYYYTGCA